jgi:thiol-disulfide isomerase/thioredoxin
MRSRRKFLIIAVIVVALAVPITYKLAKRFVNAYEAYDASLVKDRGEAPELTSSQWFNVDKPIHLADLRGQVVMLDFWRIGCPECIHAMPYLNEAYTRFKGEGVQLVSVHSAELDFERDVNSIRDFIARYNIRYPVALDNDRVVWRSFGLSATPTFVILDKQGRVRYRHVGEGRYDQIEPVLKQLLAESS